MAAGFDDPEQAFVGGVLHDVGKLVLMLVNPDSFRKIQNLKKRESLPDHEIEQRVIRTDHMEIGSVLMDKWNMPPSLEKKERISQKKRPGTTSSVTPSSMT